MTFLQLPYAPRPGASFVCSFVFVKSQLACKRAIGRIITVEQKRLARPNSVVQWVCTVSNKTEHPWSFSSVHEALHARLVHAYMCPGTKPYFFLLRFSSGAVVSSSSLEMCAPSSSFVFCVMDCQFAIRTCQCIHVEAMRISPFCFLPFVVRRDDLICEVQRVSLYWWLCRSHYKRHAASCER